MIGKRRAKIIQKRAYKRAIDGVLLFDKPSGPSSNDALQKVRTLFRAEKAGHTGSLDPLASGLLPICFGEATKLSTHLLDGDKGYRVVARLGQRTDTLDADGKLLLELPVPELDDAAIEHALVAFRGAITQVPPMFSALKSGGKALYELAREGIEIDREPRAVTIARLTLVEWDTPHLTLDVDCSTGTYIRTLVDDLGQVFGCGAHVSALRRTWAAPFRDPDMLTLPELEALAWDTDLLDRKLLPMAAATSELPRADLTDEEVVRFRGGHPIATAREPAAIVAAYDAAGTLLGIARCEEGDRLKPYRVLNLPIG
jgi:tRNA pseudouridine55 synthase